MQKPQSSHAPALRAAQAIPGEQPKGFVIWHSRLGMYAATDIDWVFPLRPTVMIFESGEQAWEFVHQNDLCFDLSETEVRAL